jgi:hypothetical protein
MVRAILAMIVPGQDNNEEARKSVCCKLSDELHSAHSLISKTVPHMFALTAMNSPFPTGTRLVVKLVSALTRATNGAISSG